MEYELHMIEAQQMKQDEVVKLLQASPYAPVASNSADEGRARSRRVERVAQP